METTLTFGIELNDLSFYLITFNLFKKIYHLSIRIMPRQMLQLLPNDYRNENHS